MTFLFASISSVFSLAVVWLARPDNDPDAFLMIFGLIPIVPMWACVIAHYSLS